MLPTAAVTMSDFFRIRCCFKTETFIYFIELMCEPTIKRRFFATKARNQKFIFS
jgi:hypothetical protein